MGGFCRVGMDREGLVYASLPFLLFAFRKIWERNGDEG